MRLLFHIVTTLFMMLFASSTQAFFWDGETACGEQIAERPSPITWLDHSDVEAITAPKISDSNPCLDETIEEGEASVCFVDAGAPMSTFPALLTQMQSERASSHILNMAQNLVTQKEAKSAEISARHEQPRAQLPIYLTKSRQNECSTYSVECESAPDPLALITITSSTTTILVEVPKVAFEPPHLYSLIGPLNPHDGLRLQTRTLSPPTPPPNFA